MLMSMQLDRRLFELAANQGAPLGGAVALGGLGGIVIVAQAWLLAQVIASVFIAGADRADVTLPLILLLVAAGLRALLSWLADGFGAEAAARVKHEIRSRAFAHLLDRGPLEAGGERTGELVATLTDGVEALDAYVARYLPQLALAAVIPLTVAAVVLSRDLLSGFILLLTAPLIPVFMVLIGRLAEGRAQRQWVLMGRLSALFLDTIQGLATIKIFGRSREQQEAVQKAGEAFRASSMSVLRIAFLSALVLELVATLSVAVVAVEVGLRLLHGRLAFEEAFFVLLLAPEFYLPLRRLGGEFHAGLAGITAADRLFALIGTPVRSATLGATSPMPRQPSIVLEDLSYDYPGAEPEGADRCGLKRVDLSIEYGERIAVVGPSGAGKSTLAAVLLRFAKPTGGRLLADGIESETIDPEDWRRSFAWVPQRPHLFADTIANNIRFARAGASDQDLLVAARRARADGFIDDLREGYDSQVGEGGARLSGGQAQRLALARAFVADAEILVLDEPSSDLDPRLQFEIDETLDAYLPGRSAVIIAHRIPTVLKADRVVVIDGGRVVDVGPHDKLLQRCALYRRLVSSYGGGD